MEFVRGQAISGFPFGLVSRIDGTSITSGTVDVYVTIDGGAQFLASNPPEHEGFGQWTMNFNGNETDGTFLGITVIHADAIPEHFTIKTSEPAGQDLVNVTVSNLGFSQLNPTEDSTGWTNVGNFYYYGSLPAAGVYFASRLNSECWTEATIDDRNSAMIAATRLIDQLNYAGEKHTIRCEIEPEQPLQFPRNNDESVPAEICFACYEIAIKLLEGVDHDIDVSNLGVITERYSGVVTAYDPFYVNEHIRAGIPSVVAWAYLKPFLHDPKTIQLSRVN
jgi:hypothetical protein